MSSAAAERVKLGIIGGTGPEGRGLALRFGRLGHRICIGSRSQERAEEAVRELESLVDATGFQGLPNAKAAALGDVVFLTIPYSGVAATTPPLEAVLRGKIVVSAIAPVEFEGGRPVARRVEAGSAAQEVARLLPDSRVVSAFQTIDAHHLQGSEANLDTDVIVCSDDVQARREIVQLAGTLPGVRALSGGRLAASRYVEECSVLLITLNRIYKSHSGIRFTGIDR